MKNIVLLFFALMLSVSIYAQECKYFINQVDPFLKVEKKSTMPVMVYNWIKSLTFQFAKIDSTRFLIANVNLLGSVSSVFSPGYNCILLFEDGSTVELPFLSENGKTVSQGTTKRNGATVTTSYSIFYELNDERITAFKNKNFIGVRFYSSDSYFEFMINDKKNKRKADLFKFFNQDINCI